MATTPNLGLHQWEPGDPFLRADFNGDFSKIDTAVGEKCRMAWGTYTGDYAGAREYGGKTVPLPFTPQILLVWGQETAKTGVVPYTGAYTAMVARGAPLEPDGHVLLKITDGAFEAGSAKGVNGDYTPALNSGGHTYLYLALL